MDGRGMCERGVVPRTHAYRLKEMRARACVCVRMCEHVSVYIYTQTICPWDDRELREIGPAHRQEQTLSRTRMLLYMAVVPGGDDNFCVANARIYRKTSKIHYFILRLLVISYFISLCIFLPHNCCSKQRYSTSLRCRDRHVTL